ncbi:MAG: hypothetical protein ACREAE_07165 [Nitrosopumilaceae archaeon]
MPDEVVIVTTDPKNGDTIEVTIKKDDKATKEGKKGERGSIRTRKWKKGKDPKKDKPYEDESGNLYNIKVKKDFSKITAKVEIFGPDITLTITFDCPDPPKKPSIRVTHIKADTTYEISPEIKKKITDFLKDANFPVLAAISDEKQEEEKKEETMLAKDLRDSLNEAKQKESVWKPVSATKKIAAGIVIAVILVIGIVVMVDIWAPYFENGDNIVSDTRYCILGKVGGWTLDNCTDYDGTTKPTVIRGLSGATIECWAYSPTNHNCF